VLVHAGSRLGAGGRETDGGAQLGGPLSGVGGSFATASRRKWWTHAGEGSTTDHIGDSRTLHLEGQAGRGTAVAEWMCVWTKLAGEFGMPQRFGAHGGVVLEMGKTDMPRQGE